MVASLPLLSWTDFDCDEEMEKLFDDSNGFKLCLGELGGGGATGVKPKTLDSSVVPSV